MGDLFAHVPWALYAATVVAGLATVFFLLAAFSIIRWYAKVVLVPVLFVLFFASIFLFYVLYFYAFEP